MSLINCKGKHRDETWFKNIRKIRRASVVINAYTFSIRKAVSNTGIFIGSHYSAEIMRRVDENKNKTTRIFNFITNYVMRNSFYI